MKQKKMKSLKMFYLNYVGCKENDLILRYDGAIGFTLTMWDVK